MCVAKFQMSLEGHLEICLQSPHKTAIYKEDEIIIDIFKDLFYFNYVYA